MTKGQITLGSKLVSHTSVGLRVETLTEKPAEHLPLICRYVYMLDDMKFQAWCEENKEILDGLLSVISVKGIRIMIGNEQVRPSFTIQSPAGMLSMPLLDGPVTFIVHRDSVSPKEWTVLVEDPSMAAHAPVS